MRVERQCGFTLIELLVVVVVIGILSAIAIPSFLKQRERAYLASVTHDLRTAQVAVEASGITNATYLPLDGATETTLPFILAGYEGADDTRILVRSDRLTYCIEGRHPKAAGVALVVRSGVAGVTESTVGC
jgi:type IV pilus assembly protein PilA